MGENELEDILRTLNVMRIQLVEEFPSSLSLNQDHPFVDLMARKSLITAFIELRELILGDIDRKELDKALKNPRFLAHSPNSPSHLHHNKSPKNDQIYKILAQIPSKSLHLTCLW